MLLLVQNRILTVNREKTFITAAVAVGATTLTVKAVDNNAWADNDWLILGEIGTPNAEVLQINGAVSDGTSLTVDNAGAGGARYAHSIDEPVYRIDYNQVRFARGTTTDPSAATTLATNQLQPDDFETRYEDTTNTTGYGFARFFNSFTNALSPWSDAIPYDGQSSQALASMINKVRTLTDEKMDDFLSDDEIASAINDKQREIINERLWTFNEVEYSASSVQYQFEYDKPTNIKTLHDVTFKTQPVANVGEARWKILNYLTNANATYPNFSTVWNNKVKFYPRPAGNAVTTALNGAITDSATTITVDSTASFSIGDYYRFIIDSEVIYATASTSTTFTGCMRGQEGTTAASHLDDATVTERDIVFDGQKVAVDLEAQNDETVVPEPIVICYGVAADFCNGKLQKPTLGDRWNNQFNKGMEDLRNRFTLKMTSQFGRVKDPREVVRDNSQPLSPNIIPQNVQAP